MRRNRARVRAALLLAVQLALAGCAASAPDADDGGGIGGTGNEDRCADRELRPADDCPQDERVD